MIIVWKWAALSDHDLSDNFLNNHPPRKEKYLEMDKVKGKLYKIFPLSKNGAFNETVNSQQERVIITSIHKGEETKDVLDTLHQHLCDEEYSTQLFLHRGHHYDSDDVKEILKKYRKNIQGCFLFQGKLDFIYYDTHEDGLLDNIGNFYNKRGTSVLHENKLAIKRKYFDSVWAYYSDELERKLFELRHHLITATISVLDRKKIPSGKALAILNDEEWLLRLRFKSLLGRYNNLTEYGSTHSDLRGERNKLEGLERQNGQSYTLDDWSENIPFINQNKIEIKRQLSLLCELVERLLHDVGKEDAIQTSQFRSIIDCMYKLILLVPGEINTHE